MRGDTEEAEEWRRKQREFASRREIAARAPGRLVCRNIGCDARFHTKQQRLIHETGSCLRTKDGQVREIHGCDVPGCDTIHVSETWMRKHNRDCRRTFEFDSPTCPSCGYQVNNRTVLEDGTEVVKGKARYARGKWEQHVLKFKKTRLVQCKWCGTPHLIPGCMATPKVMGREFRCSDNFLRTNQQFTETPTEMECRRNRPRERGDPEWFDRWEAECDALTSEDEVDAETEAEHEGTTAAATATTNTAANLDGERQINMLRGPPTAGDLPQPFDDVNENDDPITNTRERTDRRRGRRRNRRSGRQRQRRRSHGYTRTEDAGGRWVGSGIDRTWMSNVTRSDNEYGLRVRSGTGTNRPYDARYDAGRRLWVDASTDNTRTPIVTGAITSPIPPQPSTPTSLTTIRNGAEAEVNTDNDMRSSSVRTRDDAEVAVNNDNSMRPNLARAMTQTHQQRQRPYDARYDTGRRLWVDSGIDNSGGRWIGSGIDRIWMPNR